MRMRELFGMALFAFWMCVWVFLSGCQLQTLRPVADAGLAVGGMAAPQYAAVIGQVREVISKGASRNPVEGFEFSIVYRYKGSIVDAGDITWEEIFTRRGSAGGGVPPLQVAGPTIAAEAGAGGVESAEDARLREEIRQILDAAGVMDGDNVDGGAM